MTYLANTSEQRKESRVDLQLPAKISIGTQLTLEGKLKDLSLKSAFIAMRGNVFLQINDEIGFSFQVDPHDDTKLVEGMARISRIAGGEGVAIYFTEISDRSTARLQGLFK
jgi:c-di-GMP-binding flagellar brake protein YcgR